MLDTQYFKIYVLESNRIRRKCLDAFIDQNNLNDKIVVIEKCLHELELDDLINIKVVFMCIF